MVYLSVLEPNDSVPRTGWLSFEWLDWRWCLGITMLVFLAAFGLLADELKTSATLSSLLALAPSVVVLVQANGMRATAAKRRTASWQWQVHPDAKARSEGLWESEKLFDSFRHILTDALAGASREDEVYVFKRFHPVTLVRWLAGPVAVGLAVPCLALFFFDQAPWWLWSAVELAAWLAGWLLSLKWRRTVIMVTNRYLRKITRWPVPLAPLLRSKSDALALDFITTHDSKDSSIANLLGLNYGTLIADSASTQDQWANWMPYVQHSDDVNRWISAAMSLHNS